MTKSVQAIYENGVLRPLEPLNLVEKELITITLTDEVQPQSQDPGLSEQALSDSEFEQLLNELATGLTSPRLPSDLSRADLYADHD